jgi:hypothetical protein
MAIPPIEINYPSTTFVLSRASYTTILDHASLRVSNSETGYSVIIDSHSVTARGIIPLQIIDNSAETGGANQVLTAGVGGHGVVWADVPTPSLATIMSVATAGDAGGQALSNLPSVSMTADEGVSSVVLSAVAGSDVLNISTSIDSSGATKEFTRNYAPVSFGGVVYYLPLFSVPPV